MTVRRRTMLLGAGAAVLAGCKRNKDPIVPEVWDEAPVPARAEALSKLAPPWPAPARGVLDSGLLTYWLTEPNAGTVHVRLMFPDHDGMPHTAIATRTVLATLRNEVQRRTGRTAVRVETAHRPGRLELSLHGTPRALPRMLSALGLALKPRGVSTRFDRRIVQARERVVRSSGAPSAMHIATSSTIAALLDVPLDTQRVDPALAKNTSAQTLREVWSSVLDPRRSCLVVHANTEPEPAWLDALGPWQGEGRRESLDDSVARLRWTIPQAENPQQIFTDGGAPLRLTAEAVSGSARMVVGRRVDTKTPQLRAMARLAQRIAGESLDLKLTLAGPQGLFIASTSVTDQNAEARVQSLIEKLAGFGQARQPQQRLFQAAQLWLGARVVQASLNGEDWTQLWSEAMDLADDDAAIPQALAVDASHLLAIESEPLTAWMRSTLDPRLGTPGWQWSLAGASEKMERQLSRVAPTVRVEA